MESLEQPQSQKSVGQEIQLAGEDLIRTVVTLTGLPETVVQQEIDTLLTSLNCSRSDLTLDQFRQAMMVYLDSFSPQD